MTKKIAITLILVCTLLLCSCTWGGEIVGRFFRDADDKIAYKRLEQVIEAIENHDEDALKAMFSERALEEAEHFDEGMDYLFAFFQGEV